jgi:hypothetical protein
MSPIAARIAFRQAAANVSRRQVAAAAAKPRQFSVIHSLRSFARSFEPHPFERLPVSSNAQAGDWGKQVKRVGTQIAMHVFLSFFSFSSIFYFSVCCILGMLTGNEQLRPRLHPHARVARHRSCGS